MSSLKKWISKWDKCSASVITCAISRDSVGIYDKFIEIHDLIDEFTELRKNHIKAIEEHSILKVTLELEKNDRTDTDDGNDSDDSYGNDSDGDSESCGNNDVTK